MVQWCEGATEPFRSRRENDETKWADSAGGRSVKIHEAPQITHDLGVFRCSSEEATMWCGFHDVQLSRDIGSAQCSMQPNGVGQEEVACSGGQERGREALGEIAEEGGEVRMGEGVSGGGQQV